MKLMDQAVDFVNQVQQLEEGEVNVFVNELAKAYQIEVDSDEIHKCKKCDQRYSFYGMIKYAFYPNFTLKKVNVYKGF